MTRTVDSEDVEMLQDIIEEAGYEHYRYSGRGMDGEECVAINISSDQDERQAIALLIDGCQGDIERTDILSHALRTSRTDSMGKGIVLYFPNYQ
jgi:hypothetical protein